MSDEGAAHARQPAWREIALALAAFCGLILLTGLAAAVLREVLSMDQPSAREQVELGLLAQLGASILVLIGTAFVPSTAPLRGRGLLASSLALYVAFLLVWVPVTFVLVPEVWRAMGQEIEPQPHLEYFLGPLAGWRGVAAIGAVCCVGPLIEEVVFRGYLQTGLRGLIGTFGAVALTGLVFGFVHVSAGWHVLLPLSMIGWLLGWLRERSGGLLAPIVVHALHNSLTVGLVIASPEILHGVYESR
jgi:membrane protease YdiL (CAAX protease family)